MLWPDAVSDGDHISCSFAAAPGGGDYSESLGRVCSKWPWRSAAANQSR